MGSRKTILIRVKLHAQASSLTESKDGTPWLARLKSLPVDGRANQELIALVARHFHCAQSAVLITHGAKGRLKRVAITLE